MKKEAGETLRLAANPPQPVVAAMSIVTCKIVSSRDFQLNFIAVSIGPVNMRATPNSSPANRSLIPALNAGRSSLAHLGKWLAMLLSALGVAGMVALAAPDQNPAPTREEVTAIAQKRLKAAREVLKSTPDSTDAMWQLGRALFDAIAFTPAGHVADQLIQEAVTLCRQTIAKDSKMPGAHYYLALNLGHLAQTKSLGALKLVDEMEKELKITLSLDEKFDQAGPDRSLGCLYRDTPGWPVSLGSKAKAHPHLQRAVELVPEYPGNRLALAEAQAKWGEKKALVANITALRELWPRARSIFDDEKWAGDWLEWNESWPRLLSVSGVVPAKP